MPHNRPGEIPPGYDTTETYPLHVRKVSSLQRVQKENLAGPITTTKPQTVSSLFLSFLQILPENSHVLLLTNCQLKTYLSKKFFHFR